MNIMMMLRSIAPAIIPKNSWKRLIFRFSLFFCCASLTFGYLWYSSSTAYAANDNREKENTVAMQQNSSPLIHDLNTMKGTVKSYL